MWIAEEVDFGTLLRAFYSTTLKRLQGVGGSLIRLTLDEQSVGRAYLRHLDLISLVSNR